MSAEIGSRSRVPSHLPRELRRREQYRVPMVERLDMWLVIQIVKGGRV